MLRKVVLGLALILFVTRYITGDSDFGFAGSTLFAGYVFLGVYESKRRDAAQGKIADVSSWREIAVIGVALGLAVAVLFMVINLSDGGPLLTEVQILGLVL